MPFPSSAGGLPIKRMNYGRGRDERSLGSDIRGGKVHRPAFSLSYLAVALVGDARNLYLLPPHLGSSSSSSLSRRRLPPPTRVSLGGAALRRHRRGLGSHRLGTLPPPASQTRGRIRKKSVAKGKGTSSSPPPPAPSLFDTLPPPSSPSPLLRLRRFHRRRLPWNPSGSSQI